MGHVITNLRARIQIVYRDAKGADTELAAGLASLEDRNGLDLDRIAMAEAQTASDGNFYRQERRRERLRGFADAHENAAWAALRIGDWVEFARHAGAWDTFQNMLTSEGLYRESPFRALMDLAQSRQ
jgi:hypothetical protein